MKYVGGTTRLLPLIVVAANRPERYMMIIQLEYFHNHWKPRFKSNTNSPLNQHASSRENSSPQHSSPIVDIELDHKTVDIQPLYSNSTLDVNTQYSSSTSFSKRPVPYTMYWIKLLIVMIMLPCIFLTPWNRGNRLCIFLRNFDNSKTWNVLVAKY